MLLVMVICMILRGPGKTESIIGVKACEGPGYMFLILIVVTACVLTFIGIKYVQEEYEEKKKAGYDFVKGDL